MVVNSRVSRRGWYGRGSCSSFLLFIFFSRREILERGEFDGDELGALSVCMLAVTPLRSQVVIQGAENIVIRFCLELCFFVFGNSVQVVFDT